MCPGLLYLLLEVSQGFMRRKERVLLLFMEIMFLCKVMEGSKVPRYLSSYPSRQLLPLVFKVRRIPPSKFLFFSFLFSPVSCQACQPASDVLITIDPDLDTDISTPLRKSVRV